MISKERTVHINSGETFIWSLSESVLCGELTIMSTSLNTSLYYYTNKPILKESQEVSLYGKYWLNPTEHVMYSHYLEKGSKIKINFASEQGVNFFLFKGNVPFTQFEEKSQADYLIMKVSMNNIREKVIFTINSADTYYIVFDNVYDDFYSHLDFKLSLNIMDYANNDINNNYQEIMSTDCKDCMTEKIPSGIKKLFILPTSFSSTGYLAVRSTYEQNLQNTTTTKKRSQMWSPTQHDDKHVSQDMIFTIKGNARNDKLFWLFLFLVFFCFYLIVLYVINTFISIDKNNYKNKIVSTRERTSPFSGSENCLEMTYLLEESARKRLIRKLSEEKLKVLHNNEISAEKSNENREENEYRYGILDRRSSRENFDDDEDDENNENNKTLNSYGSIYYDSIQNTENSKFNGNSDENFGEINITAEILEFDESNKNSVKSPKKNFISSIFTFFNNSEKEEDSENTENYQNYDINERAEMGFNYDNINIFNGVKMPIMPERRRISACQEDLSRRGRIVKKKNSYDNLNNFSPEKFLRRKSYEKIYESDNDNYECINDNCNDDGYSNRNYGSNNNDINNNNSKRDTNVNYYNGKNNDDIDASNNDNKIDINYDNNVNNDNNNNDGINNSGNDNYNKNSDNNDDNDSIHSINNSIHDNNTEMDDSINFFPDNINENFETKEINGEDIPSIKMQMETETLKISNHTGNIDIVQIQEISNLKDENRHYVSISEITF